MSEFIVKGKHFSTKHIWFETKIDNIGGDTRSVHNENRGLC